MGDCNPKTEDVNTPEIEGDDFHKILVREKCLFYPGFQVSILRLQTINYF